MPRRSNEFQRLVTSIQRALIPAGAKITESAMVDVSGLSEPREIDVLIETAVGPYNMKIAVEAKDHHRKLSVDQFEALVGKYSLDGGIKVNKVIVITRNGFTKTAEEKAKLLNIELITLTKAEKFDWTKLHPGFIPINVHKIRDIEINPAITTVSQECWENDGQVFCSHGNKHGSLQNYVAQQLLRSFVAEGDKELMRQIDSKSPRCLGIKAEFCPDHPHFIQIGKMKFPIEKICCSAHVARTKLSESEPAAEFRMNRPIHICGIRVEPEIKEVNIDELKSKAQIICGCCGGKKGVIDDWLRKYVERTLELKPSILTRLANALANSPTGHASYELHRNLEEKSFLHFQDRKFPVNSVHFRVHAQTKKVKAKCSQYLLDSKNGKIDLITQFEAVTDGNKYTFTLPSCSDGVPKKGHFEIRKITGDDDHV